jgi:hypothetical protein
LVLKVPLDQQEFKVPLALKVPLVLLVHKAAPELWALLGLPVMTDQRVQQAFREPLVRQELLVQMVLQVQQALMALQDLKVQRVPKVPLVLLVYKALPV